MRAIFKPAAPAALLLALALPAGAETGAPVEQGLPNVPDFRPAFEGQTRAPEALSNLRLQVSEIAGGLVHPWGVALLPEGGYLVTERPGRLRVVAEDGTLSDPVAGLPDIRARGQGGLLDVTLGPDFATDRMIYWTYAKPMGDGLSATAAARGRLSEDLTEVTGAEDIFVQDPPSPTAMHYGSRILFDPSGIAYVTTGEHSSEAERVFAQDLDKTYGKVIRIRPDGSPPPDNPFVGQAGAVPAIWSSGHRNIQGAAIHPATGALWTIEHGPQGGDELNMPLAGGNYGWPVISYGVNYDGSPVGDGLTAATGMEQPVYYWDPVIAPGGMAFYPGGMFVDWEGDLLIGAMNPGALVRLRIDSSGLVASEERLLTDQGRIRDVAVAPDGALLLLVDAEDGRLLRVTPDGTMN